MANPRPLAVCDLSLRVAARIRETRTGRSWSQAYLADQAHVAPATVTVVERGQRNVTFPFLERVAAALGEAPVAFFGAAPGPACHHCKDRPGPGFTCNACGVMTPFTSRAGEVVAYCTNNR